MDKDKGFIKLDKSIFEHWIFQDAEKFRAFVDLIQLARWRDEKLLIGNEVVLIPRGSYYTSELKLADRWGWSRKKIREFFKLLEKEQMIIKKGTTKGTMLTIVNYGLYQDEGTTKDTTKEQQKNNKRTTKEHQKNNEGYTKEEIKEIKEIKEVKESNNKEKDLLLLWEQLGFGTVNSVIVEDLKLLEETYTEEWVKEAFKEANDQGVRNLKYVKGILKNWKTKGFKKEKPQQNSKKTDNPKAFNNFEGRSYNYDDLEKKLLGWDKDK